MNIRESVVSSSIIGNFPFRYSGSAHALGVLCLVSLHKVELTHHSRSMGDIIAIVLGVDHEHQGNGIASAQSSLSILIRRQDNVVVGN